MKHPFVICVTGASGAVYAVRLLEVLVYAGHDVHLVISPSGQLVLKQELDLTVDLDNFQLSSLMRDVDNIDSEVDLHPTRNVADPLTDVHRTSPSRKDWGKIDYFHHGDFMAPIASGSYLTSGMVVCPCSGSTMSAIVNGASNNLIQRAADVHLKERRPLVLVPRETPLSIAHLDNMKRACQLGATVLPAMPGWYHGVTSTQDLVDFVVARILDQLNVRHSLMRRWGE